MPSRHYRKMRPCQDIGGKRPAASLPVMANWPVEYKEPVARGGRRFPHLQLPPQWERFDKAVETRRL